MAGAFDATLKQLLDACAPDWVAWVAPLVGLPATVAVEQLDAELSTVQPVADKVFRLQPPAAGLLHIEAQSSWDGAFANRLLLYNVLLEDRYGGPVYTVARLLRREAGPPGTAGADLPPGGFGRPAQPEAVSIHPSTNVPQVPTDQRVAGGECRWHW